MSQSSTDKKIRLKKRNQKIREKFHYYTSEKHLSADRALFLLADEWLPLKESTIWLIVSRTGHYKEDTL